MACFEQTLVAGSQALEDTGSAGITQLLAAWHEGDSDAFCRLTPIVYPHLRKIAACRLRNDAGARTLQPTALVHEAYLRLAANPPTVENRGHFYGVAGRLMNQILIQNVRSRNAAKRGDGVRPMNLDQVEPAVKNELADAFEIAHAIEALSNEDSRKASIIELRYLYGMTVDEIAAELSLSTSTVERNLRIAVAWLHRYMTEPAAA